MEEVLGKYVEIEYQDPESNIPKYYSGRIEDIQVCYHKQKAQQKKRNNTIKKVEHFIRFEDGDDGWVDLVEAESTTNVRWPPQRQQQQSTSGRGNKKTYVDSNDQEETRKRKEPPTGNEPGSGAVPDSIAEKIRPMPRGPDVVESNPTPMMPDSAPCSNNQPTAAVTPDAAPSSDIIIHPSVQKVLNDASQDSNVKQEGSAVKLSEDERQKRKECLDKWIQANTDPRTNKGRYVFRRGCHKHCITKVLGGSGMHPWPIVKNPPLVNDQVNPFISNGEFYAAGDEGWNPFGPRFPGDTGLVSLWAFSTPQKEFHLFVQCSTKPHKRHWHGKNAKGGRMYVGVYQRVGNDKDGDDVVTVVPIDSKDLDWNNRRTICEHCVRQRKGHPCLPYYKDKARAEAGYEEWGTKTPTEKEILAMYEMLKDEDYSLEFVPVEFVRYDEELYQELVDSGAVINPKGQTGYVELTHEALHQFY